MPVLADFFRTCVAYLSTGYRVRTGFARYETGKFAGTKALQIEKGTTNLLTANQSNVETDTTGFTSINGATLARVTSAGSFFEGIAALRVTTGTTASAGVFLTVSTSTQGTYCGQCRMRNANVGAPNVEVWLRINYTDASQDETAKVQVPQAGATVWTLARTEALTSNAGKTVSSLQLHARRPGTEDFFYEVDALQIEENAAATSWHLGGATRNNEACAAPADRLYAPSAGTWEAWIYLDSAVGLQLIVDTRPPGEASSTTNRALLRIDSGVVKFFYWNTSAALQTLTGGAVSLGVWMHVAASWSAAGGRIYHNGAFIAASANAPSLADTPRIMIGSIYNNTSSWLNGRIGGLRFTRGRARTDADILAAYNSNAQFTEDGDDTTVFTFDASTRSLLPSGLVQFAPDSAFVLPTSVTASTSATNYPATNIIDYEFPRLPHRTTTVSQSTLTFDFGDVINIRGMLIALTNWEGFLMEESNDGTTYTAVAGSPFAVRLDVTNGYRKWGGVLAVSARYLKVTIVAQVVDGNATYFETPLVIFASDLDALGANPNWGATLGVGIDVENGTAGGHDEPQALGVQYATLQIRGEALRGKQSDDWTRLARLGNHQKLLFFQNFGNTSEAYLMRTDGRITWEEQSGQSIFAVNLREHIN